MQFLEMIAYLKIVLSRYCCLNTSFYTNANTDENENISLLASLHHNKCYIIHEDNLLNNGHYATVYKSYCDERHKYVAIKKIDISRLNTTKINNLANEINIFKSLKHPNINLYYDSYVTENNLFIVQEYCQGDDLLTYFNIKNGNFSERETKQIIKHILLAVRHCHRNNIVHRDIKPENIMFSTKTRNPEHLKLIDFGLSVIYPTFSRSKKLTKKVGTYSYIAPEVIRGNYTYKCDIWSIGVIMCLLLFGELPFKGENTELLNNIVNYRYRITKRNKKVSDEGLMLLNHIFVEEKHRYNFSKILKDKWFKVN